jgi:hypothetical protein
MIFSGMQGPGPAMTAILNIINKQLENEAEPKSIAAVLRFIDTLSSDTYQAQHNVRSLGRLIKVLLDPNQFDLASAPVEVKTKLLRKFSALSYHCNLNFQAQFFNTLLELIQEDIS